MNKIILFLCAISITLIMSACSVPNTQIYSPTKNINGNEQSNIRMDNKDELLYGKYSDNLLKEIGRYYDIQKDYTQITRDDLNKLQTFSIIADAQNDSGFKPGEVYDLSILTEMFNLKYLTLKGVKLKDYSILQKLNKLEQLGISYLDDDKVKYLTNIKSLRSLSISDSNISNINFLLNFEKLQVLSLDNVGTITDFYTLKGLAYLKYLDIRNMHTLDNNLSQIPDLDSLELLRLSNNNFKDFTLQSSMKNLKSLSLYGSTVESVNLPSEKIPNLNTLELRNTTIKDMNKLSCTDNLQGIDIKGTKVEYITPLKKFKNLRTITVDLENIRDKDVFNNTQVCISNQ